MKYIKHIPQKILPERLCPSQNCPWSTSPSVAGECGSPSVRQSSWPRGCSCRPPQCPELATPDRRCRWQACTKNTPTARNTHQHCTRWTYKTINHSHHVNTPTTIMMIYLFWKCDHIIEDYNMIIHKCKKDMWEEQANMTNAYLQKAENRSVWVENTST